MQLRKPLRKVLLAVQAGRIDSQLLLSARSLCERMDAGLDILAACPDTKLPDVLERFADVLRNAGLSCAVHLRSDLRPHDIVRHANTHECIVTVVIDSPGSWEKAAANTLADPWAKLACPLVTVASHTNCRYYMS